MRILDSYIRRTIFQNTLLVALMLAALFSFLEILEQLNDLDQGNYTIATAAFYVVLTLPRRLIDLTPIIAMLGTAFALNTLAKGSELVAMRAAGISSARLAWSVMKAGIVIMLVVALLDEFIAPPLQQHALRTRNAAVTGQDNPILQGSGFWSSKDGVFAHVWRLDHGRLPADVDIFEFDDQGRLVRYLNAATAETSDSGDWLLQEVKVKTLTTGPIEYGYFETLEYPRILRTQDLEVLEVPSQTLATSDLYGYVNYLHEHDKPSYEYEMSLWRKLARPLVTGAMVLVAIPFGFGTARAAPGRRITFASLAGLVLYLINEISGNAGALLGITPQMATLMPIALILLTAMFLMRRTE